MAPPTHNTPPSLSRSLPHRSSQDVAHAGAWAQQTTTTNMNDAGGFVLAEHPDVGTVRGRNIGEILQEYNPQGEATSGGGWCGGVKNSSSSVGGEYRGSENGA
jgi:hypothetical protein